MSAVGAPSPRVAGLILTGLFSLLVGCADGDKTVPHRAPDRGQNEPSDPVLDPRLFIGTHQEGVYKPLSDGAEIELVWGPQGALHLEGILEFAFHSTPVKTADLVCSATLDDALEGYVTINGFPIEAHSSETYRSGVFFIFLRDTDPGFYAGQEATVVCEVTALDTRYAAAYEVLLVDRFD